MAEDAGRGRARALEGLARARASNAAYVSRLLRLTLLAPEIVEAILDGRQPVGLQLDDLLKGFPSGVGKDSRVRCNGGTEKWIILTRID